MAISRSSRLATRSRSRARAPRNSLNRERVLVAATELLDNAGPDAFTMRALARHLGVATMAVYSHFSGKDEIVEAVRLRLLAEASLPPRPPADDPGGPREEIRELCRAVYRLLDGHPSILRLLADQPVRGDESTQFADRLLEALLRAGSDPGAAARAYTALVQFTLGAAMWAARGRHESRLDGGPPPADRYPHSARLAAELELAWDDPAAQYERGLDALLTGLLGR